MTIWLSTNGHCLDANLCQYLQNCTTFYGNLIIRTTVQKNHVQSIRPYFPELVEITGYLVITLIKLETVDIFPSLSVIRGKNMVANYAVVVYHNNDLKALYFPNLTTILKGGLRIARNSKLCYANGVRWKSIIKVGPLFLPGLVSTQTK